MDPIEKAKMLIHTPAPDTGAAHSANVTTIYGVATSGSVNGSVMVDLGGHTVSTDDTQAVEIPCTCDVREGDMVLVQLAGADGSAKSMTVTGVVGGGDRTREKINSLIASITEQYGVSGSLSKEPEEWTDEPVNPSSGSYIWTRSMITYASGQVAYSDPYCTGDNGSTIISADVCYYSSDSPKELTGGSWDTQAPDWIDGKYVWQKTITRLADGSTKESDPVCLSGSKGDKGDSGEDAVLLRIDSSKGNLFKNNMVSTILSVTIIKGGERISSSSDLKRVFGESARLEWLWKRMDDSDWSTILASDSRLSDEGFIFQLSPDDVETKEVFTCNLII